jgi:outer membrane protein
MTRKLASITFAVLILGMALMAQAAPDSAPPAGAAGTKIGIVDIRAAIAATNEGQQDFGNLEKKFEPTRLELQNNNTELDNLKKQLQTQGDKLNDAARADMAKSIETKQKSLQRKLEDAQADWQNQQGDIANRIGGKMIEVIEKYATSNGYAVILDVSNQSSPILWANASANITKAIVDAYNAQSNVRPPTTAASAPAKPAAPAVRTGTAPTGAKQ